MTVLRTCTGCRSTYERLARSYRDLLVWQKAKGLAVEIYRHTERFPSSETYGLRNQLRRAGVSVASNIAEGQGRLTKGEFRQFLGHARGSVLEIDTQLAIAFELGYLNKTQYELLEQKAYEVLGLLNRLLTSLCARRDSE
ncbi:MAG: four helix bundle protein [Terriglobales bacterium]